MKTIKLAIVEDHQSMIDGISLLLKYEAHIHLIGYFTDGKALLDFLETATYENFPDVVLTDIKMPQMNGVELTNIIKKTYSDIAVIAFSMISQPAIVEQMISVGVSGYLLKNSSLDMILTAIQEVYNGAQFFDASLQDIVKNYNPKTLKKVVDKYALLTKSEKEILKLIGQGKISSEIAAIRFTAVSTVEKHRKNMIKKLELTGKNDLLRFAVERNMMN
jgi:two-component system nitrate/nitrite response regulator NarL